MSISHQASTGSPAASAQGTTSINVSYPAGVAAGRIAILIASVKLSSATFGTVTGFDLIGTQTGGTGTSANDAGTTRVGVWYRVLTGSESGSVNVTNDTGVSSCGAMSIYTGTAGGWATPAFVAGSDTGHGANWSAACGAWAATLNVDDMLVVANSTDTDAAQTITSPTITQTGATFGARTQRNASLSTSGTDSGAYSWDASVTAGSANAPTWTHTSATSTCGATVIVRLREVTVVNGTGDGSFTFSGTGAGTKDVSGAIANAVTFTATAAGVRDTAGQAVSTVAFSGTGVGTKDVSGSIATGLTFTGSASGEPATPQTVEGQASGALTFTGSALGEVDHTGVVAGSYTFTATGSGVRGIEAPASAAVTFDGSATGTVQGQGNDVEGTALAGFTFTARIVIEAGVGPPVASAAAPGRVTSSTVRGLYSSSTPNPVYASSNGS